MNDEFVSLRPIVARPVGSLSISEMPYDKLFASEGETNRLLNVVGGRCFIRVERDASDFLHYYRCSPSLGSHLCSLFIGDYRGQDGPFYVAVTWTPFGTKLSFSAGDESQEPIDVTGGKSPIAFRVGRGRTLIQIPDNGNGLALVTTYRGDVELNENTGAEIWQQVDLAAGILLNNVETSNHVSEIAVSNAIVAMSCTGFEAYCRARFLELEKEGLEPDIDAIIDRYFSVADREANVRNEIERTAVTKDWSPLEEIVRRRKINFQDYGECRRAFRKAYGISFSELGLSSHDIERLKTTLGHRHRIVHKSPLISLVVPDADQSAQTKPKQLAEDSLASVFLFVRSLHQATCIALYDRFREEDLKAPITTSN